MQVLKFDLYAASYGELCRLPHAFWWDNTHKNYTSMHLFAFWWHFSETLTEKEAELVDEHNSSSDEIEMDDRYKHNPSTPLQHF